MWLDSFIFKGNWNSAVLGNDFNWSASWNENFAVLKNWRVSYRFVVIKLLWHQFFINVSNYHCWTFVYLYHFFLGILFIYIFNLNVYYLKGLGNFYLFVSYWIFGTCHIFSRVVIKAWKIFPRGISVAKISYTHETKLYWHVKRVRVKKI